MRRMLGCTRAALSRETYMGIIEDRETHDGTTREYYVSIYLNVLDWLVGEYRADPAGTSKLCDEKIDRSGRLLGRVRDIASRPAQ